MERREIAAAVITLLMATPLVATLGCGGAPELPRGPVTLVKAPAGEGLRVATATASPGATVDSAKATAADEAAAATVPSWAADAVFYQLFPERFCNGDTTNDPTRESLEFPGNVSDAWRITPWTSDWYARADWEKERGHDFFEHGVFDRRYGGDLQGVIDKLHYLEKLGINALYLNPVFYARSLHKYDGNTFHHIDPHFGPDPKGDFEKMARETSDPATWQWTAADKLFLELVADCHKRGIRVVIDGVFNHTGRDFFAFADLVKNQANSPYADWYIVPSFDDPETPANEFRYKGWWGVDTLPEFADNEAGDDLHAGPKKYIFDATKRWMDPNGDGDPADGIDGWRLDVAAEVPTGFWRDWNTHCREINSECYTVAEHWDDAAEFLADGGFSATMNYHGFSFPVKGYLIDGTMTPTDAARELKARMEEFVTPRRYALQNLIDSHDTDRVASMVVNAPGDRPYLQPQRHDYDINERVSPRYWGEYQTRKPTLKEQRVQRLVALMQVAFVGPPMLYYGTEAGMWGGDDPCDRKPMVWEELDYDDETADPRDRPRNADAVAFDGELFRFYQAAFHMRTGNEALRRGDYRVALADDEQGVLVIRRATEHEAVYIVFNRGEEPAKFTLPTAGMGVQEVFTASGEPEHVTLTRKARSLTVELPGVEGVVLRQRPPSE